MKRNAARKRKAAGDSKAVGDVDVEEGLLEGPERFGINTPGQMHVMANIFKGLKKKKSLQWDEDEGA